MSITTTNSFRFASSHISLPSPLSHRRARETEVRVYHSPVRKRVIVSALPDTFPSGANWRDVADPPRTMSTYEQQQKAPQEIRNVVNFLRSSKAGLKNRVGVLNGKRVDYFKGESCRLSPLSLLQ